MRRVPALLALATWVGVGGCATTTPEERPPVVLLTTRSESTSPVYDSLSPGDRIDADTALARCRDGVVGCDDDLRQLETGAPVAMAVAERVCLEGRADLCARLARLHLRGVGPGTSRAEGIRLLSVACQARLAASCANLALALREDDEPAHRSDVQDLFHYACGHGQPGACALEEKPTVAEAVAEPAPEGAAAAKEATPAPAPAAELPALQPKPSAKGVETLVAPGRILLLGSVFGTREAPDFTSRLVHDAVKRGVHTVLALDVEVTEGPRLEAFLRSPGDAEAVADLLKGFWVRPYQDGRSSRAVLRMIVQARSDIASGLRLGIVPIDEPLDGQAHTLPLSKRLDLVAQVRPDAAIVALLGNLQAVRVARVLRAAGHRVTAVLLAHDGGFTWGCGEPKNASFDDPIDRLRGLDCRETLLYRQAVKPIGPMVKDWDPIWAAIVQSRTDGRLRLYALDPGQYVFNDVLSLGLVSSSTPAVSRR